MWGPNIFCRYKRDTEYEDLWREHSSQPAISLCACCKSTALWLGGAFLPGVYDYCLRQPLLNAWTNTLTHSFVRPSIADYSHLHANLKRANNYLRSSSYYSTGSLKNADVAVAAIGITMQVSNRIGLCWVINKQKHTNVLSYSKENNLS
jgi:hypothetical protein